MPQNDENERPKSTGVNRRQFITRTAAGAAGAVALTSVLDACSGSSSSTPQTTTDAQTMASGAWKFAVMSDTQWTGVPDDGNNPNSSAVHIASQIQQQLISQGVKFVVHVGDLCDNDSLSAGSSPANSNAVAGETTRALYAQALYNAGIGFFPHRGNHDDGAAGAKEFQRVYPQTQNGQHNTSPADVTGTFASTDPNVTKDAGSNPYAAKTGSAFTLGSNFSSPDPWSDGGLKGLSYSFDVNNARFILLDQFTPATAPAGYNAATTIAAQQAWISQQLSSKPAGSHAFVFSHKGLITCNHTDVLFGNDPSQNPTAQNAFFSSLFSNKVGYYINGHDHMHDRSLIASPDGQSSVMQILTASNSSKFYVPQGSATNVSATIPLGKSNDTVYNSTPRRQVLSQELYTVGYYVFTVNGSTVTVDYYSADVYPFSSSTSELLIYNAVGLNFTKRETFGYGLNGKQFVVKQGQSYVTDAKIQDASSAGTTAKILSGSNGSHSTDAVGLAYVKVVTTGWIPAVAPTFSDILSLRGLDPFVGGSQQDTYTLSMALLSTASVGKGLVLCALDSNGNWNNAVNQNSGGTKNFVNGPWSSSYGLGTYGIDPTTNSAWAVLNYDGAFAVAPGA